MRPGEQSLESGQTLIIIVMVMVLSLATGLAVSTRSTSTVHQTSNLAASEQALAAAESASEIMLKQTFSYNSNLLNVAKGAGFDKASIALANTCTALPCFKDMGNNAKASVNVVTTTEVADPTSPFEFTLESNDVQQMWLNNGSGPYTGQVSICWQKNGEVGADSLPAALEIKVISGSSAPYSMITYTYDTSSTRQTTNGFSSPVGTGSNPYNICNSSFSLTNAQALRIKALYTATSVRVSPAAAQPAIPYQGNIITSVGYAGDSKRVIQVIKTLPQLQALFDYGVYSGGTFSK